MKTSLQPLLSVAAIVLLQGCAPAPPTPPTRASRVAPVAAASAVEPAPEQHSATPMVAMGLDHTCFLSERGEVFCWGRNNVGQVGGDEPIVTRPRRVDGVTGAVKIAAGRRASCALLASGELVCWGGIPVFNVPSAPTKVAGVQGAVDVTMSGYMLCVLGKEGDVSCGVAHLRQGGRPTEALRTLQPRAFPPAVAIDATHSHVCALQRDPRRLHCDRHGAVPPALAAMDIVALGAGFEGGCAKATDGALRCWGERDVDGLRVVDLDDVRSFDVSQHYACAVTGNGSVWCWGDGPQLGDGVSNANKSPTEPQRVKGLTAVSVHAVDATTCAVKRDGGVACWGSGSHGQLGNGRQNVYAEPVRVASVAGARDIAIAGQESCALVGEALTCWGGGNHEPRPQALPPTADVAGTTHDVCVALKDGRVRCRAAFGSWWATDKTWREVPNMRDVAAIAEIPYGGGGSARGMMIAVHRNGKASAFLLGIGSRQYGRSTTIAGPKIKAVAAGGNEFAGCLMAADGTLACFSTRDIWGGAFDSRRANVSTEVVATDAAVLDGACFTNKPGAPMTCVTHEDGKLNVAPERPKTARETMGSDIAQPLGEIAGAPVLQRVYSWPHWCSRTQSDVYCWGENRGGAVGVPVAPRVVHPVDVPLP